MDRNDFAYTTPCITVLYKYYACKCVLILTRACTCTMYDLKVLAVDKFSISMSAPVQ